MHIEEAGLLVWSPGQYVDLKGSIQESERQFTLVKNIFNLATHAKVMQTFIQHLYYAL